MNVRLFGVAAVMAAAGLVACGDDTGGEGGAGGASSTTSASGSTSGSPASSGATNPTTTSGGQGGDPGPGSGGAGGEGAGEPTAPCATECAADEGCNEVPANPEDGGDCAECVLAEAAAQSECAIAGAFSADCQDNEDCAAYVDCVLNQGETCGEDFPEGAAIAAALVLANCGECGDGSIGEGTGGGGAGGSGTGGAGTGGDTGSGGAGGQ